MSLSFQERFKNRTNFMGKQGDIVIESSQSIVKPLSSQVFNAPQFLQYKSDTSTEPDLNIKEAYSVESPQKLTQRKRAEEPFPRKQAHSAKPYRVLQETARIELKSSQAHKQPVEYKPYTLKDYQIIKSDKYYELGGLGPSNLGTEDWKAKKEMLEKKNNYAKQVKIANFSIPNPSKRIKAPEKEISSREKALQFARMIPKPPLKPKISINSSTPPLNSILEELEKQHASYKSSVEAIKSFVN